MFKVNNNDTNYDNNSGVFVVKFEHILHLFSSVSTVGFE